MGLRYTDFRRAAAPPRPRAVRGALLACGLAVAATGLAQAQSTPDTELTPEAKPADQWVVLGGAEYGLEGELVTDSSPTPYTVDFFTTSFSPNYLGDANDAGNPTGFFGGAECVEEGISFAELEAEDCERRPAIYRYAVDELGQSQIEPMELGEEPGFVGAIAWIDGARALAVGGSGEYPRRELTELSADEIEAGESYEEAYARMDLEESAGEARAWLYEDADGDGESEWTEITDTATMQPGMGGLTALDCARRELTNVGVKPGVCLAGGLKQMWWWKPATEGFAEGFWGPSVTEAPGPTGEQDFHFRVRQISFSPNNGEPYVVAVTSGCCAPTQLDGGGAWGARVLSLEGSNAEGGVDIAEGSTGPVESSVDTVESLEESNVERPWDTLQQLIPPGSPQDQLPEDVVPEDAIPDRILPGELVPQSILPRSIRWRSETLPLGGEDASAAGAPLPDSYYDVVHRGGSSSSSLSGGSYNTSREAPNLLALAAPGGSSGIAEAEPGSRIVAGPSSVPADPDILDHKLDSLRLLAMDDPPGVPGALRVGGPAWAVGGDKVSEQGVGYTTIPGLVAPPRPLTCPLSDPAAELIEIGLDLSDGNFGCEPAPENVTQYQLESKRLVGFPTYTLNSLAFVPETEGIAWAAGDRGAIVRLGGEGAVGAGREPTAPSLRPVSSASVSDRGPYEPHRPGAAQPGTVPPLATQPLATLDEPTATAYGTPDPTRHYSLPNEEIASIAMSRDGTEGWAVGAGYEAKSAPALHHFSGGRWTRCDIDGFGGRVESDTACSSLTPLLDPDGAIEPVTLFDIERIPFEEDDDPTNDDEFAAIAIGSNLKTDMTAAVLTYLDGRWEIDEEAGSVIKSNRGRKPPSGSEIEMISPSDGWFVSAGPTGYSLYHYGGDWPHGQWELCAADRQPTNPPPACGDNPTQIPMGQQVEGLQIEEAGGAVFVAGRRLVGGESGGANDGYPFVMSMPSDEEVAWTTGLDPGCAADSTDDSGSTENCPDVSPEEAAAFKGDVFSLSLTELPDGEVAGWLLGWFGYQAPDFVEGLSGGRKSDDETRGVTGPIHVLMRREPGSSEWRFHDAPDAADRVIPFADMASVDGGFQLLSFAGPDGAERSFIAPGVGGYSDNPGSPLFPPLEFDPETERWRVMPAPFLSSAKTASGSRPTQAIVKAMAPDGLDGLWIASEQAIPQGTGQATSPDFATFYHRYTPRRHRPVFEDTATPVEGPISGIDGTEDGTVWVASGSDRLFRYDRLTGWEAVRIPGWDRGRVVTRPSRALAIAVNDSGVGIAVGEEGRIADISPDGVRLDPASASRCSDVSPGTPCGTPQDLRAAAVAPDGSAIAGGEQLTLVWRPAGGDFRTITAPRTTTDSKISGLTMPIPGRAWAVTDRGEVWAGTANGSSWTWRLEAPASLAADERADAHFPDGRSQLNAIAIDEAGRGLAVGDRGAMLERSGDGSWERLDTGYLDNLYSIALPPAGYGDGTLVGGGIGLILTRTAGQFHTARPADITEPLTTGPGQQFSARIVGLAIAGGSADGETEAWAASQVPFDIVSDTPNGPARDPKPHGLLHYASGEDPLLHTGNRSSALPDAPPPGPEALDLAAFGRSECHVDPLCPEFQGTNLFNEVIARQIHEELPERQAGASGAMVAVDTGGIGTMPGRSQKQKTVEGGISRNLATGQNVVHEQWRDLFAEPLIDDGVPLFNTPGLSDLSGASACSTLSPSTNCPGNQAAGLGTPTQWSETFSTMPAPWGTAEPYSTDGYTYQPLESTAPADTANATGAEAAHTHYALDVVEDATGEPVARLVFADTSNARSLTASDPNQNPLEPQSAWLEEVLCSEGSPTDAAAVDCTRPPGLPAVVVTTTPTYSYGPGGVDGTQTEGAAFEEILLRNKVTALITGHLGWNGLYYTHAPGLHSPAPGGEHPDSEHPPQPPAGAAATGLLPTVVASSAGGRFGIDGTDDGEATEGYWHGYSVVRIPADGDPSKVIVEQRPILDWIGIEGQKHVLRPRQKLVLGGYGREPLGTDTSVRIDRIENEAVTHRFDLVAADPEEPWMPLTDTAAPTQADGPDPYTACGTYTCLTEDVGTIDPQSGEVRAGSGRHPGAYAIALLSVGQKAATYPIYFEKSPSFKAAASPTPRLELKVATPPPPPGVETPPVPSFQSPTFNAPQIPTAPLLAVPVALTSTPAQPPAPPVPPPAAPANPGPSPLDLSFAPTGLTVAPTASVIPPPAPPIQPAPPGGARKEARQRQAAAQKSGADGAEGSSSESQENAGDLAQGPPSSNEGAMTRLESPPTRHEALAHHRSRPEPSFTPLARAAGGANPALYGGGLLLMATVLAFGFSTIRPRPRRGSPEIAFAWSARQMRGSAEPRA